ncbi:MAG TPA: DUF1552 domain-containing protein [Polyangia bacterium]|nr:DUF1552 domain-containing protein [Polyangia bacterium]
MISYKFARRSFLRGVGASASLIVPLLRSIEARAAGGAAPLRLLVISHPLGANPDQTKWVPTATKNFTLPFETAPFAPLQKYMCMVDGVNIVTAGGGNDSSGGSGTHEGGTVAVMTGVPTIGIVGPGDHCAGGPSIDQILLDKSAVLGGPKFANPTPFGSLQLGGDIRSDRDDVAPRVLSYLATKQGVSQPDQARSPLFPTVQPLDTYNRIFGGALPTGMTGAQRLAGEESIVSYLNKDLKRMQSLVPASEKDRLGAHANAISQLEASIKQSYGMGAGTSGCVKPAMPPTFANTTTGRTTVDKDCTNGGDYSKVGGVDYYLPNDPSSHPFLDLGQTQLRLIKAAFQCDLVRVATFLWASGTDWVVFPGTFQGASLPGNVAAIPHHPPSHSTDANTQGWLSQVNQFYSTATSQVLQEFATTPDIDGNMLIDNTVIVYVTEVARAYDHDQRNLPVIIFGGKNTGINGGTVVKVTGGSLGTQSGGTGNRPMNDVWLALASVFGVNMTTLGSQNSGHSSSQSGVPQSTGPLPGIIG